MIEKVINIQDYLDKKLDELIVESKGQNFLDLMKIISLKIDSGEFDID